MRKLFLSVGCALILLATATVSDAAKIYIKISDGTTTKDVSFGSFVLSKDTPLAATGGPDATDTLTILTCATRPCTGFFPGGMVFSSGQVPANPPSGSTFKIKDLLGNARVEKFDSGSTADRVSLKGVEFTSLTTSKVLTVTYGVETGGLRSLPLALAPATSKSYAGTLTTTGSFKGALVNGSTKASACPGPTSTVTATDVANPCLKITLALNGTGLSQGEQVQTVGVPCSNSATGSPSPASVNPCGVGGSWSFFTGGFTAVNQNVSLDCPNTCSPSQKGTLVAKFNAASEVLQLTASSDSGMSSVGEEAGAAEEVLLGLANELGTNLWVAYTPTNERCEARPKSPTTNDTRNVTNKSSLPISFEYWCGFFAPLADGQGLDLVSIVDLDEAVLAGSAATRNNASRVGFLPGQGELLVKNITTLNLSYEVLVSPPLLPSGNSALGDLEFTDCNGSFYVALELLTNQGAPAGTAKVYLGSTGQFKTDCLGFGGINTELTTNGDARVDISGLAGNLASPTFITFGQLKQGNTGNLRVRKISVIVDHGDLPLTTFANHKVKFLGGTINGFPAGDALQVVTGLTRVTQGLSTTGVSIVITKVTGTNPGIKKVIRNTATNPTAIQIIGGKFDSSVKIIDIDPQTGQEYTIALCPNGAVETSLPDSDTTTPVGICIANQAFMTLQ